MLGALLDDIVPGPTFITDEPVLTTSIYIAFFTASFIMIGMQSVVLRAFVLVTRIKTYVLATVILTFATIGVFALHNSAEDIWTLFFFGILDLPCSNLLPPAPMILGVVLGDIAELNLARALAINPDPSLFYPTLVTVFRDHRCFQWSFQSIKSSVKVAAGWRAFTAGDACCCVAAIVHDGWSIEPASPLHWGL